MAIINSKNRELFVRIFQAAAAIRDLKPWNWMGDAEIVAVRDPDSGEVGHCVVMGGGGEVYGLAIYVGKEGVATLERTLEGNLDAPRDPWLYHGFRNFMVDFVDREEITDEDRELYAALGLKFKGKNQWIKIGYLEKGYLPHLEVTEDQLKLLLSCLEQTLEVAFRLKTDASIVEPREINEEEAYLHRHPLKKGGNIVWEDRYELIPQIGPWAGLPAPVFDAGIFSVLKQKVKQQPFALCYLCTPMPMPIMDQKNGYFPIIGMVIDYGKGTIDDMQLFPPDQFTQTFYETLAGNFYAEGGYPEQLVANSAFTAHLLEPMCKILGIKLYCEPGLEQFTSVMEGLIPHLASAAEDL